jgi:hypothetical protein
MRKHFGNCLLHKNNLGETVIGPGIEAHACNPNFLGSGVRRIVV